MDVPAGLKVVTQYTLGFIVVLSLVIGGINWLVVAADSESRDIFEQLGLTKKDLVPKIVYFLAGISAVLVLWALISGSPQILVREVKYM